MRILCATIALLVAVAHPAHGQFTGTTGNTVSPGWVLDGDHRVGRNDIIAAHSQLYGDSATQGARLSMFNAAAEDGTFESFLLEATTSALAVTGNVTISGTLTSGAYTPSGHIIPGADLTYNLGSSTVLWDQFYGRVVNTGKDDLQNGTVAIFGDAGANGGILRIYNGATTDGTVDRWQLTTDSNGNLEISGAASPALTLRQSGGLDPILRLGVDDSKFGNIEVFGDDGTVGGQLTLHNGATDDTTVQSWGLDPNALVLNLGPNTDINQYQFGTTTFTAAANIQPELDSTYDLGLDGTRWNDAYIDDIIVTTSLSNNAETDLLVKSQKDIEWTIDSDNDAAAGVDSFLWRVNSGTLIATLRDLDATTFAFTLGSPDTSEGNIRLYGDNATGGASQWLYNSANEDTTVDFWVLEPQGASFYLGPNTDLNQYQFGTTTFTAAAHIQPQLDSTNNLGTDSVRWLNGYFDNVDAGITLDTLFLNVTGPTRFTTGSIVTIGSGQAETLSTSAIIAAETGTADDLTDLDGGNDGVILYMRADAGDTITVKHNAGTGSNNILTDTGVDVVFSGTDIVVAFHDGTQWLCKMWMDF